MNFFNFDEASVNLAKPSDNTGNCTSPSHQFLLTDSEHFLEPFMNQETNENSLSQQTQQEDIDKSLQDTKNKTQ